MTAVTVGANVIVRDGEFLLVQEGKDAVADTWNLPGGRTEPAEDPIECARREALEEASIDVEPASLVGIYFDRSRAVGGQDVVAFVFHSRVVGGTPRAREADSVVGCRWIDPSGLDRIAVRERYVTAAIEDYANGERASLDLIADLRD